MRAGRDTSIDRTAHYGTSRSMRMVRKRQLRVEGSFSIHARKLLGASGFMSKMVDEPENDTLAVTVADAGESFRMSTPENSTRMVGTRSRT